MMRRALTEHTEVTVTLGAEDINYLLGLASHWRSVRLAPGGALTINPGSTVGVLRLPSGMQLEILPKVPLRNLLWMLSEVHGISLRTMPEQVTAERFDEVIELLVDTFARLVERRIDLGLYRNYVEEDGDVPAVRGRILIAQDIHRNAMLRHRTYCRFTTYSWDLPENQVIRQVVRLLSGWGLSRELTSRLVALDRQMDAITPGRLVPDDIDRFVYSRQSEAYRPIHRLCRIFLESASFSEQQGRFSIDGFLLDMNVLYEKFVTDALKVRLEPPYRLDEQVQTSLDVRGGVAIRPDIVISRNSDVALVADCKYKTLGHGEYRHNDLYQLLAYTTALGIQEGALIYPRHLVDLGVTMTVRNAGARLHMTTVNLGADVARLRAELDALAWRLEEWASAASARTDDTASRA